MLFSFWKNLPEIVKLCYNRENHVGRSKKNSKYEVVSIMMRLFDEEQIMKMYAKDIEKETATEMAKRLIKKGKMSFEEIADCVPALSLEELKEIEAEIMQLD